MEVSDKVIKLICKASSGKLTEEERAYYIKFLMSDEEQQIGKPFFEMDEAEELEYDKLCFNNKEGNLTGYNCPICKNKGEVMVIKDGVEYYADCTCMPIRRSIDNMQRCGLGNLLNIYTFKNYKCTYEWQTGVLNKAQNFVKSDSKCFAICGQSGSGKSHICTAIARALLKQGNELKYMQWIEESMKIKQATKDSKEYANLLDELKYAPVLYIDDFLKTEKGTKPTPADIRLAIEIINYRYNKCRADSQRRWVTLLSTELLIQEINALDNALAGRIVEMAKPDYLIQLVGADKNYRLKTE